MNQPNFLIIGTVKAGTTSLNSWLKQHPEIYMAPNKETHFFSLAGENLDFLPDNDRLKDFLAQRQTTIDAYRQQFEGVTNEVAVGEASPFYLYHPQSPERIYQHLPDAKLIAILRNPMERAYSNFLHHLRDDMEPLTDFAKALQQEEERISNGWWWGYYYTKLGFYYEQLQRYLDRFEPSQLKVYLYEDLSNHPLNLLQDLFQFLNVDDSFTPDISIRYNATGVPKNKLLSSLIKSRFAKASMKRLPEQLRKQFVDLDRQNLIKPTLPSAVRKQLIEVYREDILKMQNFLQRDLSHWLE